MTSIHEKSLSTPKSINCHHSTQMDPRFLYLKRIRFNSDAFTNKAMDKRESDIAGYGHCTSGILVIFLGIMATLLLFLLHSAPSQSYAVRTSILSHHNIFPSGSTDLRTTSIKLLHSYLVLYFWSKLPCLCVGRIHLCCLKLVPFSQ